MIDPQLAVMCNLNDAGCDAQTKEKFLELHSSGKTEEELHLLQRHRKTLLDKVHKNQKKIDCLDFLIFKLQQTVKASNDHALGK